MATFVKINGHYLNLDTLQWVLVERGVKGTALSIRMNNPNSSHQELKGKNAQALDYYLDNTKVADVTANYQEHLRVSGKLNEETKEPEYPFSYPFCGCVSPTGGKCRLTAGHHGEHMCLSGRKWS